MKLRAVIDTNIIASGLYFGGFPRRIVEAVADGRIDAIVTPKLLSEYHETIDEMRTPYDGRLSVDLLQPLMKRLEEIESPSRIRICRDPKDDMFLECAVDGGASFIITGDEDLLALGSYEGIEIIKAHDFYDRFLASPPDDKPKEA